MKKELSQFLKVEFDQVLFICNLYKKEPVLKVHLNKLLQKYYIYITFTLNLLLFLYKEDKIKNELIRN